MIKQLFTEFPLTDVPQERTVTEEKIRKYTYTKDEVDVLIEQANKLLPVEVKSGQTVARDFLDSLKKFRSMAGRSAGQGFLVYGGTQAQTRDKINIVPWKQIHDVSSSLLD